MDKETIARDNRQYYLIGKTSEGVKKYLSVSDSINQGIEIVTDNPNDSSTGLWDIFTEEGYDHIYLSNTVLEEIDMFNLVDEVKKLKNILETIEFLNLEVSFLTDRKRSLPIGAKNIVYTSICTELNRKLSDVVVKRIENRIVELLEPQQENLK